MLRTTQANIEPVDIQVERGSDKEKKEEFVDIPLDDSGKKDTTSEFKDAVDAFKTLLDESVINAVSKQYTPPMNIFEATWDAFYEDEKFSWAKTLKVAGALAIGGLASVFTVTTSASSAHILQTAFKDKTHIDLTHKNILTRFFQIANTGESAALGTFSGMSLIEAYLGKLTPAEKFLTFEDVSCGEQAKRYGRKTFDLICAAAANVPTFFFAKSTNVYLAVLTALANTSISWLGVSSLPLTPSNIHPARRIELAYMHEQLETFLKLPSTQQIAIMDEIDAIRKVNDVDKHKKIYARLLNLAKPAQEVAADEIKIQQEYHQPTLQQVIANSLAVYMTLGQINYTEGTYHGISHAFKDSGSAPAIATGSLAALFSVLPNVGFGYSSGTAIANSVMTDNVPLAKLYLSKTREILKYTIGVISLFAGGTTMAVSLNAAIGYAQLTHMKEKLTDILKITESVVGYSGGVMIDAYYTMRLCDEILIYLAQRCGDEPTKRLFTFTLEMRRLHKILGDMNNENYLEMLRWKMEGNTELSNILHVIFDNRMSEGEYLKTQQDLNKNGVIVRNRGLLPHYQVIPSFFARQAEENQQRHPGLRHRVCGFFSRCKDTQENDIESHGVEMQARR